MTPRYKERIPVQAPVTFSVGSQVGQGLALDLTVPGCRIESPMAVYKSQSVQLKMFLPGLKSPLLVALGIVRWTNGKQFGVEFIKMDPSQRQVLDRFVAHHLARRAPRRNTFSEQGQNWHLDTYSGAASPVPA